MRIMPLQELIDYTFRLDLDSIPTTIRIYWNEYSDADKANYDTQGVWFMGIENRILKIDDIKLVTGTELMWSYSHIDFGGFLLFDSMSENLDPEFIGMGNRWQLYYLELSEVAEFRQALNLETI